MFLLINLIMGTLSTEHHKNFSVYFPHGLRPSLRQPFPFVCHILHEDTQPDHDIDVSHNLRSKRAQFCT